MKRIAVCSALALSLSGCKLFYGAPVPMHSIVYADQSGPAKCLLVLLPGLGDADKAFEDNRFISMVREQKLSVDLVAADATLGYYLRGMVVERLDADVVAKTRGRYAATWLVGVSMGGMGSLLYARDHGAEARGLLLLAPYLGDDKLVEEIRAAGGPLRWKGPAREAVTADNYQRQAWGWLAEVISRRQAGPEIYLGYGSKDKSARNHGVLAGALPPDHVYRDEGDHDWGPWRSLFAQFLTSSAFARECGGT